MKYLKLFETYEEYENFKTSTEFIRPNISYIPSAEKSKRIGFYSTHEIFQASDGDFYATEGIFKVKIK